MRTDINSKLKLGQLSKRYYCPESEVDLASLTRFEKVYTKIVETPNEGAADAALDIAEAIERCVEERGRCVIGFGAGKGVLEVYDELVRLYFADKVSFAKVVAFNISELGFGQQATESQNNFRRLQERLFNKIDIDPSNVYTFDEGATKENVHRYCKQYETLIDSFGGIDLLVCQLTKNGGLAFNEPGSQSTSSCRLVLLSNDSRQRIADSYQCEVAPDTAVTLGMSNLLAARKVICVAWGEASAEAVYNTIEGRIGDNTPASFLQMHHDVKLLVDLDAASLLTRISFPWKVTSCEWTDELVRRAIVWLSQQTGKPILKLTNKDYNDNGLSELVTVFGSGYDVNIRIFNVLQHTITGWPGGKPNADDTNRPERALPAQKRVIVFSPHPDDDVISMGGTIRRLVQQNHEVHIAYETSGNIAVGDEEVTRFMHFVNGYNQIFCNSKDEVISKMYDEIKEFLAQKKPSDMDIPEVRTIKGLIRRGEARTACTYNGIPLDRCHFLDLPFYESGKIEKLPMGEADVKIVRELLQKVKPHQIYVAGDLADPHGTHRKCTDAVMAAIDLEKEAGAEWLNDCRIWMYRGAWAEWEIENIEMCVPMSPEELRGKRNCILKHASQMESAPFLGNDERLFWQRAEDRNHATAELYHSLGLACYEAMEAFVRYNP